ncbi:hypothetical protein [Microcoleus anatoxicus]|uniref:hypothetical protein n=1 Tax=Microcoleus anatoxicus TaxID=2705319 RepID=UPI0030C9F96F
MRQKSNLARNYQTVTRSPPNHCHLDRKIRDSSSYVWYRKRQAKCSQQQAPASEQAPSNAQGSNQPTTSTVGSKVNSRKCQSSCRKPEVRDASAHHRYAERGAVRNCKISSGYTQDEYRHQINRQRRR